MCTRVTIVDADAGMALVWSSSCGSEFMSRISVHESRMGLHSLQLYMTGERGSLPVIPCILADCSQV